MQGKYFLIICILSMCSFSTSFLLKVFPQMVHANGRLEMWADWMWRFKLVKCKNVFEHFGHVFWPLGTCTSIICRSKLFANANISSQIQQLNGCIEEFIFHEALSPELRKFEPAWRSRVLKWPIISEPTRINYVSS